VRNINEVLLVSWNWNHKRIPNPFDNFLSTNQLEVLQIAIRLTVFEDFECRCVDSATCLCARNASQSALALGHLVTASVSVRTFDMKTTQLSEMNISCGITGFAFETEILVRTLQRRGPSEMASFVKEAPKVDTATTILIKPWKKVLTLSPSLSDRFHFTVSTAASGFG
jgi:hypothetical protein